MDEVAENLKACLLTSKGGISESQIDQEYYDVTGDRIPYKDFNFATLKEFLDVIPGIRKVCRDNEYFYEKIPSEKTAHIADLVSGQRVKKKRFRRVFPYNKPVRAFCGSSQNYRRNEARSSYPTPKTTWTHQNVPRHNMTETPPRSNQRPNHMTVNELSKYLPTKQIMDRDPRSASRILGEWNPKIVSYSQNHLTEAKLETSTPAFKRTVSQVPSRNSFAKEHIEDDKFGKLNYNSFSEDFSTINSLEEEDTDDEEPEFYSMIPFEQFLEKKKPETHKSPLQMLPENYMKPIISEEELAELIGDFQLPSPIKKISPVQGSNCAQFKARPFYRILKKKRPEIQNSPSQMIAKSSIPQELQTSEAKFQSLTSDFKLPLPVKKNTPIQNGEEEREIEEGEIVEEEEVEEGEVEDGEIVEEVVDKSSEANSESESKESEISDKSEERKAFDAIFFKLVEDIKAVEESLRREDLLRKNSYPINSSLKEKTFCSSIELK